jgi:hypothetical protein
MKFYIGQAFFFDLIFISSLRSKPTSFFKVQSAYYLILSQVKVGLLKFYRAIKPSISYRMIAALGPIHISLD